MEQLNRATYTIGAVLTTTSPLMISSGENAKLDVTTLRPVSESNAASTGAVSFVKTQRMKVLANESTMPVDVPVIPANNMVGRLRRHAAKILLEQLAQKKEKVSIGTYSGLLCGAINGNATAASEDIKFPEYERARSHLYLGLFGGGPRWMARHLRAHSALPYLPATQNMLADWLVIKAGTLGQVPIGSKNINDLFGYWIQNRNDDLDQLRDMTQASEHIEDFREKLALRQQALIQERLSKAEQKKNKDKAKEDQDKDKEPTSDSADQAQSARVKKHITTTRSFSGIEFVVPGVSFMLEFELLDVTPAQLGLFLHCLDRFAQSERLGCQSRNGFGKFKISDLLITTHESVSTRSAKSSPVRVSQLHEQLQDSAQRDEYLGTILPEFEKALESVNANELEDLFLGKPETSDAPGKAKMGKEEQAGHAQTT